MLILPNRFTQQPQYATQLDRSNPLSIGLGFIAIPGDPDIIQNVAPVIGGSFSYGIGSAGRMALSPSTQVPGYVQWSLPISPTSTADYSLAVIAQAITDDSTATPTHNFPTAQTNFFSVGKTLLAAQLDNNSSSNQSFTASTPTVFVAKRNGSTATLWAAGNQLTSWGTGTRTQAFSAPLIGRNTINNNLSNVSTFLMAIWVRALSSSEIVSFSQNPWQLFKAPERKIWVSVPSGPTNVTGGWTDTQANNTASITGLISETGTLSATQADNTASISGIVGAAIVSASWNGIQSDNVSVIVGNVLLPSGAWSSTQSNNSATVQGSVLDAGAWSGSQQNNSANVSVSVTVPGAWSSSQGNNTATITGNAISGNPGNWIVTQADNSAAIAAALSVNASMAAVQSNNTAAFTQAKPITFHGADDKHEDREYKDFRKLKQQKEQKIIMAVIKEFLRTQS